MERENVKKASSFWQRDADYHGVLLADGDLRLIVSPNGKRYLLQRAAIGPKGEKTYMVLRHRKWLSKLVSDLPQGMAETATATLPENACDFPRPWAAAMKAQSDRVKAASLVNNAYAGEIVRFHENTVRIIIRYVGEGKLAYAIQQCFIGQYWEGIAKAATIQGLIEAIAKPSGVVGGFRGEVITLTDEMRGHLAALPDNPQDWDGELPEPIKVAASLRSRKKTAQPSKALPQRPVGRLGFVWDSEGNLVSVGGRIRAPKPSRPQTFARPTKREKASWGKSLSRTSALNTVQKVPFPFPKSSIEGLGNVHIFLTVYAFSGL